MYWMDVQALSITQNAYGTNMCSIAFAHVCLYIYMLYLRNLIIVFAFLLLVE